MIHASRLRRLALLVAATVALALSWGRDASAQVFNPKTFTLDNGLQVVLVENDRVPAVVQMLWYKVGAADEPRGKSGIAHFLEHLMFKGTETVAPGAFSRTVARHGGRDNAFTGQDFTGYHQTVARDYLELVMEMEADRMANLVLTDAEVDPEREVILEERRSRVDNQPAALLGEAMGSAMYRNHPYRFPIIGWESEMRGLTRQDALDFYEAHYAPNNAVLVVAGDVSLDELRRLAEKHYGPIPRREVAPRDRPEEPPQIAARRVVLESPQVREPSLRRNYLAPSRLAGETRHAYPLDVLSEIMGGTTGRLYRDLVIERGVATAATAWYSGDAVDMTTFGVYAAPRPGRTLEEVEEALDAALERLLREGVTEEEVADATRRLTAAAVFARDDLTTAARVLGSALVIGLAIEDVEQWPQRIAAVTAEEVDAAAAAVLLPRQSVTGLLLPEREPAESAAPGTGPSGIDAPAPAPARNPS
ncbi:MAG: M16 family metallopeptidase [Alphaproteobacteria bacterium]